MFCIFVQLPTPTRSICLITVVWMTFSQISTTLVLLRVCTKFWSHGDRLFIR